MPDGYAEAFFKATRPELGATEISSLVELQLHRQRPDHDGRTVDMILDESVLLRSVGSTKIMADQLGHLLTFTNESSVTLRVICLATAQPVLSPSFTLLSLSGPTDSTIACLESIGGRVDVSRRAADVNITKGTFDMLAISALSPTRSAKLISRYAGSCP